MSVPQPERVVTCIHYTPGLTTGKTYVVKRLAAWGFNVMVEVVNDAGYSIEYWAFRFSPGPPVPPKSSFRFGV